MPDYYDDVEQPDELTLEDKLTSGELPPLLPTEQIIPDSVADDSPSEEAVTPDDQKLSEAPELLQFPGNPKIIPRASHPISRKLIDYDALKVMYRLIRGGYKAFLVGGGVRDLMLGKRPKDFDVGTSAKPEEVRTLFRNSRIIGRRFRMNQVYFRGGKIIEVATFRARTAEPFDEDEQPQMLGPDNTYGNEESDALRRDLTVNGLIYDPNSYAVIDYVGGIDDLNNKIIRIIGEPEVRLREDPVRMVRAVRHAARNDFTIEPATADAIRNNCELISKVTKARVYDEFIRDVRGGFSQTAFKMLHEFGLLKYLLPEVSRTFEQGDPEIAALIKQTLERIDRRIRSGADVPTSVAFLALSIDCFADVRLMTQKDSLKNLIDDLYREVGVTKRDREDMERIIFLAHQMFKTFQVSRSKANALADKPYAREALIVLELTANNAIGIEALEFWEGLMRRRPTNRTRHPSRGGQRRNVRPRRRR